MDASSLDSASPCGFACLALLRGRPANKSDALALARPRRPRRPDPPRRHRPQKCPYRYSLPAKAEAWRADPIHPDNLAAWFKVQGAEIGDGETTEE